MIRVGHVYDNWMVDVSLTNEKLRTRGLRILTEATGATAKQAERALIQSGDLRAALLMLKTGMSASAARLCLRRGGSLRQALGEFSASGVTRSRPARVVKITSRKRG